MYRFLTRIRKVFSLSLPKGIGARPFCAIVCLVLSCTLFFHNAFAFFGKDGLSAESAEVSPKEAGDLLLFAKGVNTPVSVQADAPKSDAKHACNVQIHADGKTIQIVSAAGKTVGDIIGQNGISLNEMDGITPGLTTPVANDTEITITRIASHTEEVIEPIPFEAVRKPSDELPAGDSVVVQKGVDGQQKKLVEIYTKDGVETLRRALQTTVLQEPVSEITEYGTGGTVAAMGQTYAYKKVLTVSASAYTTENSKWKNTASGTLARVGAIAVDPNVIPMGTRMLITSEDGESWVYGVAVAEDRGSSIKGNKIDIFFNTRAECLQFGVRKAKVYILK